MKVAILGTRGIPNYYGGFEQFAEYFAVFLAEKGHEVYCYNIHHHPYQEKTYKGVQLIYQFDYEPKYGTAGQFLYDLNCIKDARARNFDIILQLGYTSSSVWYFLLPKKPIIITNMDGLEWKRTKYNKLVQRFLKFAEKLAVQSSDYLVSDSIGIKKYLDKTYQKKSTYIAYGADVFDEPNPEVLKKYQLESKAYHLLIARFEPENNLQIILDGFVESESKDRFVVIGNHQNKFGSFLKKRYQNYDNIKFLGQIYHLEDLNNLRYFSQIYFHGHSVGGTNPSLLEAMASQAFIAAHQNEFNQSILEQNAVYFKDSRDVKNIIKNIKKIDNLQLVKNNFETIKKVFNWDNINEQYLKFFEQCLARGKN